MRTLAIIGGGPAGLMAATVACANGVRVDVYEAMPSVGRKFLMAGKGGLNLTHAEPAPLFATRYGLARSRVEPWLQTFGPDALRAWVHQLGIETFVGSSQRVFPKEMKAAPLLRAWLRRLRAAGVVFHVRHRWTGWNEHGALTFSTPEGDKHAQASAVVLALGGGSWAQLGSDGAWTTLLAARGVPIVPWRPTNCGFDCNWSAHFRTRYAGQPLKSIVVSHRGADGREHRQPGECIVTENGLEGGVIYALSAALRDTLTAQGGTTLTMDLAPGYSLQQLEQALAESRGKRSLANHLQSKAGITGVKAGLLREGASQAQLADALWLAARIKACPLTLTATRPLNEAISSAGGVAFTGIDETLMLRDLPGVFCAGEMLDWEAPTGGYLLTACCAGGYVAGQGALAWLNT